MATKDIRNRLYAILDTITPDPYRLTVTPRIPRAAQDWEGYFVVIDMVASTGQRIADKMRTENLQWRIRLYSPALGMGLDGVREDAMYDLRDKIIDKLEESKFLDDPVTRRGLNTVQGVQITSERYSTPVQFAEVDRALWECTVTVLVDRRTC